MTLKRQSHGPRPLHLLDTKESGPSSAPLAYSTPPRKPPSRRQSSISYLNSPENEFDRSLLLGRSHSLGNKSAESHRERKNTVEPVTLVEKHADLLHFIAQKESKCLELRSQLAMHEAELLQLKRKWERIVSRGFDRANSPAESSPTSNVGQGAVLEGIKEGVQGVSRFIAAGLTELSSPGPSPTASLRRHVTQQSSSSVSTSATKSTRFSLSSASSLGEDAEDLRRVGEEGQVLIVQDTGATPTMSPNPVFMHQQQQRKEREVISRSSIDNGLEYGVAAKMHRRKSREHPPLTFDASPELPQVEPPVLEGVKQRSASASTFPPPASTPGLGSLTVVRGVVPVSSWVGKRWEELQRGTSFSKSQKRASVLLSDVSQTIVSALSVPYTPSMPPPSSPAVSLLDDDDDSAQLGTVMTPDTKNSALKVQDDDEEWNW